MERKYAPELNPIECGWSAVKGMQVANLWVKAISDPDTAVTSGARAVGEDESLLQGCLPASGLYDKSTLLMEQCNRQGS